MIRNSFGVGPEGWHSYDYHGEIVTGAGIFPLTTWQKEGASTAEDAFGLTSRVGVRTCRRDQFRFWR